MQGATTLDLTTLIITTLLAMTFNRQFYLFISVLLSVIIPDVVTESVSKLNVIIL